MDWHPQHTPPVAQSNYWGHVLGLVQQSERPTPHHSVLPPVSVRSSAPDISNWSESLAPELVERAP